MCYVASIAILCPAIAETNSGELSVFEIFSDCDDCSSMIVLPAGKYMMGSTSKEFEGHREFGYEYFDETPRHQETIGLFAIGRYNVTRRQFSTFATETGFVGAGCYLFENGEWKFDGNASWKNPGFSQTERDPVVCVSWNDANAYIKWLNDKLHASGNPRSYRLPAEAEWEYAARAGVGNTTYWGGNQSLQCDFENARNASSIKIFGIDSPRVQCDTGFSNTAPVGSFRPNPWGLFDMLGNAYQWVEDCARIGYRVPIPTAPNIGAMNCSMRTLRGASWATIPFGVRAATRLAARPASRDSTYGFRLVTDNLFKR